MQSTKMKLLQTLQRILSEINEKEANQFREYATFKNEKKLLKLFDVIYKHDKSVEVEYLLLYLKRKKIQHNLRNNCKKLNQLLLRFWSDNSPKEDKNIEISRLMHGASVLVKRGLIKEGLEMFEKAKEISETTEKYSYQFEILRLSFHWSNLLAPKNAHQTLNKVETQADLIGEKMQINLAANVLSEKVHYAIFDANWAHKPEDKQFFKKASAEANRLLKLDACPILSKFICHNILGNVNASHLDGDQKLIEVHTLECMKIAKTLFKNDPKKFGPLLIQKTISLLILYFLVEEHAKFDKYYTAFKQNIDRYTNKDVIQQFNLLDIELLRCILFKEYSTAQKEVIPATIKYLEKNAKFLPINCSWDLYALCFEIKFSMGMLEEAEWFLNKIMEHEVQALIPNLKKYFSRLYILLYNFETGNYDYVENAAKSTRRLYSDLIKGNPGGKLFLKYIDKLAKAHDHKARLPIFKEFKKEIDQVLSIHFYRGIIGVNILSDWLTSKVNKADTIQEYSSSASNQ